MPCSHAVLVKLALDGAVWHQGPGQRIKAQEDEIQEDNREGWEVAGGVPFACSVWLRRANVFPENIRYEQTEPKTH